MRIPKCNCTCNIYVGAVLTDTCCKLMLELKKNTTIMSNQEFGLVPLLKILALFVVNTMCTAMVIL